MYGGFAKHMKFGNRNEIVHSQQPGLQSRMEEELFAQVQKLYSQKDLLPADDRIMLDMTLDQRILQPAHSLQRWLDVTLPTVHRSIELFTHHNIFSFIPWQDVRNRQDCNLDSSTTAPIPNSTFTPWQDVRLRSDQLLASPQNSPVHQSEATLDVIRDHNHNNSQESLSSCRK